MYVKVVLRCATVNSGEPFVTIHLILPMPLSYAANWDSQEMVIM